MGCIKAYPGLPDCHFLCQVWKGSFHFFNNPLIGRRKFIGEKSVVEVRATEDRDNYCA